MAVEKLLLRPGEVGEALGISKAKVYQMIRDGDLPSVTLAGGRLVRVPVAALAAHFTTTTHKAGKKTNVESRVEAE